jgi:hypothetical protein
VRAAAVEFEIDRAGEAAQLSVERGGGIHHAFCIRCFIPYACVVCTVA